MKGYTLKEFFLASTGLIGISVAGACAHNASYTYELCNQNGDEPDCGANIDISTSLDTGTDNE